MRMASLNISLPQSMKDFVEIQVQESGYSTPSEYIRALVREDQKRRIEEKLELMLVEGIESGDPIPVTPEFWEQRRKRIIERYKARTKAE